MVSGQKHEGNCRIDLYYIILYYYHITTIVDIFPTPNQNNLIRLEYDVTVDRESRVTEMTFSNKEGVSFGRIQSTERSHREEIRH